MLARTISYACAMVCGTYVYICILYMTGVFVPVLYLKNLKTIGGRSSRLLQAV